MYQRRRISFLWWFSLIALFAAHEAGAQTWTLIDGRARDVGVGANGTVWVIGSNQVPGGYDIYKRMGSSWTNVPGGAERIAVDPQGNAWVVNNTQTIFRHDGTNWVTVSGQARDVGVGANGTVWVIGNNAEAGGYDIYRSTDKGANWTKIAGSALRIAVDQQGNAWVVNNSKEIYRYDGSKFVRMPGSAQDVGTSGDGAVWVIGTDDGIYRWDGSNWLKRSGGARNISAAPNNVAWVVNQGGEIYQGVDTAPTPAAPVETLTFTLHHDGAFLGWMRMQYTVDGRTEKPVDESNIAKGWHKQVNVPKNATNIHVEGWSNTGLVWDQWKKGLDKSYADLNWYYNRTPYQSYIPVPPCLMLSGTSLAPTGFDVSLGDRGKYCGATAQPWM